MFLFGIGSSKRSIHLSTSIKRDFISKQANDLFFISMSINSLRSELEFLMRASLIVSNREDNILDNSLAMLWGCRSFAKANSSKKISSLWVLGRPYILRMIGWYLISENEDFSSSDINFCKTH